MIVFRLLQIAQPIGESYSGSITVSKTVHGGSNPSSPAKDQSLETLQFQGFLLLCGENRLCVSTGMPDNSLGLLSVTGIYTYRINGKAAAVCIRMFSG